MKLQSCNNCWFNGLQYGVLGLSVGYCSRHRKILNAPGETTCGWQLRKDLTLGRAVEVAELHQRHYAVEFVARIVDGMPRERDTSHNERDIQLLGRDPVAGVVLDHGELGATVESLAQLKAMPGSRAELAMLSLARGYVSHCVSRKGNWTSGLHLYWWSRQRLGDIPEIEVEDLHTMGAIQLSRQINLTSWSLMMFRLTFIEDMIVHARQQGDPLGNISSLTEQAALALSTFNVHRLSVWLKTKAIPQLDARLPRGRYMAMARELQSQRERAEAR